MYLLQGQRLDWGEGGAAAYEDVAEVRAAGFGSTSTPAAHPHTRFFFSFSLLLARSLSLCFGCALVYCSLTYFYPSNSTLFASFLSGTRLSFLPSCLFYSLSVFIALDWACMGSISNANCAAWIDRSYVLPIAICSKGRFDHFRVFFLSNLLEVFLQRSTGTQLTWNNVSVARRRMKVVVFGLCVLINC